jgi:hypothetical protein
VDRRQDCGNQEAAEAGADDGVEAGVAAGVAGDVAGAAGADGSEATVDELEPLRLSVR